MPRLLAAFVCVAGVGGCGPAETLDRTPPEPVACGEVQPWKAGDSYRMGNKVTAGYPLHVFECRPWPNEGWCSMIAYKPAKTDGPWADAWRDLGPCPAEDLARAEAAAGKAH